MSLNPKTQSFNHSFWRSEAQEINLFLWIKGLVEKGLANFFIISRAVAHIYYFKSCNFFIILSGLSEK